ncbi:cell wall-binding repeat-containing protein [Clostridium senegalense]|uniref:cell wall-binding repeat-containing protein n=1 Tax=Clostridium senegalense TaxID=1465809 RepID=UPI001C0F8681|nr:cell wall-binding repeat-containing protein [Clostridium senegalense]MBU5228248.1 cell wall-binding repeat-containing protein [Clostridium senegalense]
MRSKKLLKTIAMVCIFAILSSGSMIKNTYADENGNWTKDRIWGSDRFETANKIADEFCKTNEELGLTLEYGEYFYPDCATTSVDTVILANGFNYPDALCATPLSRTLNAPILLTHQDNLTDSTKKQIEKIKIKNITLVGGTSAISENVENQLKSMKINVSRLGGIDRYDTSYLIAEKVTEDKKIKQATAVSGMDWHDAMIASSAAAIKDAPLLLVPTSDNEVLPKYKSLLEKNNINIVNVNDYGSEKELKTEILSKMIPNNLYIDKENSGFLYKNTEAPAENKYVNCFAILNQAYTRDLPYEVGENVFLTRGDDFADSLAVAPLAAKKASPIAFGTPVHKGWSKWDEFVEDAKLETIRLNYQMKPEDGEIFCNKVTTKILNTMRSTTLIGGSSVMPENADDIFRGIWE